MTDEIRHIPGAADVRIQQPFDLPKMTVNVDRTRAQSIGLTQKDVATSLLLALSGSFQTSPSFFLDPKTASPTTWRSRRRSMESARWPRCKACPSPAIPPPGWPAAPRRLPERWARSPRPRCWQSGLHYTRLRDGHRKPL